MARHGLVLAALLVSGCGLFDSDEAGSAEPRNQFAEKRQHQQACASSATYDRLKELAFDEAARIRGRDANALDQIAGGAVVRMENPVVQSRDEDLNVTTCSGRLVLELPPGSETALGGQRRLAADVQYAAQNAADGSGMVYQLEGAEPIIQRLATIGGAAFAEAQPVTLPQASAPPGAPPRRDVAPPAQPVPTPPRTRQQPAAGANPTPGPAPAQAQAQGSARPSFNCRVARSRSERQVCGSAALAARDRQMSAVFYSALADADPATRARLRSSRDRFLAFRERCGSDACIAQAYADRIDEIRDIAAAGE